MNWYWIIAGAFMIIGGLMHTIIGEKNVIRELHKLKQNGKFPTDEAFNLIRWFWYMGSFFSFWIGAIGLTIGLTDGVLEEEVTIAKLMASFMFGFSILTFGIVALLNPKDLIKINQVFILIVVMILFWLGAVWLSFYFSDYQCFKIVVYHLSTHFFWFSLAFLFTFVSTIGQVKFEIIFDQTT